MLNRRTARHRATQILADMGVVSVVEGLACTMALRRLRYADAGAIFASWTTPDLSV